MRGTVGEGWKQHGPKGHSFRARSKSGVYKRRFASRYPQRAVRAKGYQCPFCGITTKRRRDLINHSPDCKVYASNVPM